MQGHEVLLTTAELAVAFVGFAAIVMVFQRRQAGPWGLADIQRFWVMIVSALLALVFSLIPLLFIAAGRSSETTWSICSAAMAVFVGAQSVGFILVLLGKIPRFNRVLAVLLLLFALPTAVVLVFNVLNVVFHRSLAGYLVGLFYLIAISGTFFARLVYLGLAERRND